MEEMFGKREKDGKTTVDHLTKWLKDSNLVENEDAAKHLFKDVKDKKQVELSEFQQILDKVAHVNEKDVEDIIKALTDKNKITSALKAGLSAFLQAMKK